VVPVEELIDGEPLAKTIQRGAMEPLQAIELMIPIAEALRDAHGRGIIHGDISAQNLMLERSLPPRARIIDLSECRFQDAFFAAADQRYAMTPRHHGDSGRVCGHTAFAAPELFKGGVKSERADIYSLGAVLFMLLTGAQNPNPVIRELLSADDDGTRLRERLVGLVPELGETFIAGDLQEVLALDPSRRTASMSAVLDMLCAERDALKELRNQDRSAATAARAVARELPRAARPASRDMSSRPSHWASAVVALAIAVPLIGVSTWWALTRDDRTPPPIAAAAPPIEPPTAPLVAPAPAPTPAAVATPPKPTVTVTKAQVEHALEFASDLLRACPDATDYLYMTVGVGEATELLNINYSKPARENPLDRCVQDIVEKLHFPRSRPVRHTIRVNLRGQPLQ
jgi:serine/threonine-protein kinase